MNREREGKVEMDRQDVVPFEVALFRPVFPEFEEDKPTWWIAVAYFMRDGEKWVSTSDRKETEGEAVGDLMDVLSEEGVSAPLWRCTDPNLRRRLIWSARMRMLQYGGVAVREVPSHRENRNHHA